MREFNAVKCTQGLHVYVDEDLTKTSCMHQAFQYLLREYPERTWYLTFPGSSNLEKFYQKLLPFQVTLKSAEPVGVNVFDLSEYEEEYWDDDAEEYVSNDGSYGDYFRGKFYVFEFPAPHVQEQYIAMVVLRSFSFLEETTYLEDLEDAPKAELIAEYDELFRTEGVYLDHYRMLSDDKYIYPLTLFNKYCGSTLIRYLEAQTDYFCSLLYLDAQAREEEEAKLYVGEQASFIEPFSVSVYTQGV